ncbi:MAG: LysR family transcriptional regulator [Betaproteobacteria bacterium]|nr:MAG: LysR family transcriptional regulator [Betaproteobacteria bacterium]
MDKFKAMAAFVRIVDAGSLTAAADALDVSQPSMVRLLAALEAAVGVRLINRTTRRMALTDEGREYYERCKLVLAAVDEAEASLSARRAEPRGRLRITSSVTFGRALLVPLVVDFMAAHPQLRVEAVLLDRVIDLIEEGIDVGVRLAHLPDSSLVAVRVGETRRIVVGSAALIRRHRLVEVQSLKTAPCVSFMGLVSPQDWPMVADGQAVRVPVNTVFATNQIDAAIAACQRGLGYAQFFDYQVQESLRGGKLKPVLEPYWPTPTPIHVVYPQTRLLSANVRSFVDFVVPRLRSRIAALRG